MLGRSREEERVSGWVMGHLSQEARGRSAGGQARKGLALVGTLDPYPLGGEPRARRALCKHQLCILTFANTLGWAICLGRRGLWGG